jgi:hypothetical protein
MGGHGSTDPRRVSAAAIGLVLVAALVIGCSAAAPTSPPGSADPSSGAKGPASSGAGSSVAPTSGASTPAETPWQAELEDLQPDGTRSLDSALRLFAMAFGPIPGVGAPPAAPGTVGSASPALQVIQAHIDLLSADQRAAVQAAIEVHETHAPIRVTAGTAADRSGIVLASVHSTTRAPTPGTGDALAYSSSTFYADLQSQADRVATQAAQYYGAVPNVFVRIYDDANQALMTFVEQTPAGCDVFVNQATVEPDLWNGRRALSLDIVHCFEIVYLRTNDALRAPPPAWAWDGPAEYVLLECWPPSDQDQADWQRYFTMPDLSLFQRGEDAVGFFAQARHEHLDLATAFRSILADIDNPVRYAAVGAGTASFLDTWASGLARTYWSDAWGFDGPGLPGTDTARNAGQPLAVANGAIEAVDQEAYTNHLFAVHATADILEVDLAGHARLGDGTVDSTELGPGFFCTTDQGCGPCPDGSAPAIQPTRLAPESILAISGGTDGTTGTVSGHPLDEYCHTSPPPTLATGAVQVKDIRDIGGHQVTFVDMVSCDGPWGHWDGELYGIVNVSRHIQVFLGGGSGDATVTTTPTTATVPHGVISISGDVDVTIEHAGTTLVLSGTTNVVFVGANGPLPPDHNPFSVAYQVEPADPGRCP